MQALKYHQLDCQTLTEALKEQGIIVTEIVDLSNLVPHVAYGGACKSSYVSPRSGKIIYALERNALYAPDAWLNDVWQFDEDFTISEAVRFLSQVDATKKENSI